MNPIFVEYYSHFGCDCYKIKNPWTSLAEQVEVLCRVDTTIQDRAYSYAKDLARFALEEWLTEALKLNLIIK